MTQLSPSAGSTSSSLIHGLKARDDETWRRLVDLYSPLIYSWCRRSGLDGADAAEVMQETLRGVARGIATFQPQPGASFRGWLRVIASHKIRDFYRRTGREPAAAGGTTAQQALNSLPGRDEATEVLADDAGPFSDVVHRAIQRVEAEFEPHTWQAFWLTTVENLTAAEAGARLGMQPNAVRQAKFKVLRRLRQELGVAAGGVERSAVCRPAARRPASDVHAGRVCQAIRLEERPRPGSAVRGE